MKGDSVSFEYRESSDSLDFLKMAILQNEIKIEIDLCWTDAKFTLPKKNAINLANEILQFYGATHTDQEG